jgi:hypothetical protein
MSPLNPRYRDFSFVATLTIFPMKVKHATADVNTAIRKVASTEARHPARLREHVNRIALK